MNGHNLSTFCVYFNRLFIIPIIRLIICELHNNSI